MKFSSVFISATALGQCATAVAVPNTDDVAINQQSGSERTSFENLWKRKGGGSGGGRGSSSGSSSSGSSSSSGKGGSTSSSGSGRGSSSSSTGGSTTTGSGVKPSYGGGAYYGGGAKTPYSAGGKSPSGIVPGVIVGSALGFWGAYWLLGAYSYPFTHSYYYHNATNNQNETKPVTCLCAKYQECSCDDNGNQTYFNSVIGDGTYAGLNKTLVTVADVNGTSNIYINGTLANGTTASSGTEDPNSASDFMHSAGWLPIVSTVIAMAYLL